MAVGDDLPNAGPALPGLSGGNRKPIDPDAPGKPELAGKRFDSDGKEIPPYIQEGFSKDDIKNMGGSLKIHARIALEIDIRVMAKIRGDIAVGIL